MKYSEIFTFTNPADLFREFYTGTISDKILYSLDHVNDFETFGFLVVNGETVVTYDVLNGYVYDTSSLEEFFSRSIDWAMEA